MTSKGNPDPKDLFGFLNEAYGKWGSKDVFEWRYWKLKCPKRMVTFYDDGDLAAFRGIIFRDLVFQKTLKVGMLIDAAVAREKRRKGYYKKLVEKGLEISKEKGSFLVGCFAQVDNITYKNYQKKGWANKIYPLKIKVLSYDKIENYFLEKVLANKPSLRGVYEEYRSEIELFIEGQKVTSREPNSNSGKVLKVNLSNRAVEAFMNNRHLSLKRLFLIGFFLWLKRRINVKIYSFSKAKKMASELLKSG